MDNPASLNAENVALFLQNNPQFFQEHAELFANLAVPHPQQTGAISLGERQILLLRDKSKQTEKQLLNLLHHAKRNESISAQLLEWNCSMLAEPDAQQLPELICNSLKTIFDLPIANLLHWQNPPAETGLYTYIQERTHAYCGPARSESFWQDLQEEALSVAIIPLKTATETQGVLVLGATDTARFTRDMATDFLDDIAQLCSAALARLHAQDDSD